MRSLAVLAMLVVTSACAGSEDGATGEATRDTSPTTTEVVTPVRGEPCSYLGKGEVVAAAGIAMQGLTVTGQRCTWSFQGLRTGEFAGESPSLQLSILDTPDAYQATSADPGNLPVTPISDLGNEAFFRSREGLEGGETFVLRGNVTLIVVFQLVFDDEAEQAAAQESLARLVVSRL